MWFNQNLKDIKSNLVTKFWCAHWKEFWKVNYTKKCWDQGLFIHVLKSCLYNFNFFVLWWILKKNSKICFFLGQFKIKTLSSTLFSKNPPLWRFFLIVPMSVYIFVCLSVPFLCNFCPRITSHQTPCFTSQTHHVTLHHITSLHTTLPHITNTSCHITSHNITYHHITSHHKHIMSHHIT